MPSSKSTHAASATLTYMTVYAAGLPGLRTGGASERDAGTIETPSGTIRSSLTGAPAIRSSPAGAPKKSRRVAVPAVRSSPAGAPKKSRRVAVPAIRSSPAGAPRKSRRVAVAAGAAGSGRGIGSGWLSARGRADVRVGASSGHASRGVERAISEWLRARGSGGGRAPCGPRAGFVTLFAAIASECVDGMLSRQESPGMSAKCGAWR
jgi:hypothetical protein